MLSISKRKIDRLIKVMRIAQGKHVRLKNCMTTEELTKSIVRIYFRFIKAKDGPATKTNLDMTKAI